MESLSVKLKRRISQSILALFSICAITGTIFVFEVGAQGTITSVVHGTTLTAAETAAPVNNNAMWAYIAAAVAFGLGAIGAGLAIASVGAAAMGAVAEKPEIAGQALIFVALAEGLVVFGFIMGLLILGKV